MTWYIIIWLPNGVQNSINSLIKMHVHVFSLFEDRYAREIQFGSHYVLFSFYFDSESVVMLTIHTHGLIMPAFLLIEKKVQKLSLGRYSLSKGTNLYQTGTNMYILGTNKYL